jgi:cadmium resistance protein CadD (predicted permease)
MFGETLFAAVVGVLAFAATNLDGLFLVMLLLAMGRVTRGEAAWGQVLGTAALMALSFAGGVGTALVPNEWHHLLGLIPLGVGIKQLYDSWHKKRPAMNTAAVDNPAELAPTILRRLLSPADLQARTGPELAHVDAIGRSGLVLIALLTIAHGGDNLGVYIALFASQSIAMDGLQVAIALGMAWLWGRLSAALVTHRWIGGPLRTSGPWLLPWVLIALGVLILIP